jgi:hypothetical protein
MDTWWAIKCTCHAARKEVLSAKMRLTYPGSELTKHILLLLEVPEWMLWTTRVSLDKKDAQEIVNSYDLRGVFRIRSRLNETTYNKLVNQYVGKHSMEKISYELAHYYLTRGSDEDPLPWYGNTYWDLWRYTHYVKSASSELALERIVNDAIIKTDKQAIVKPGVKNKCDHLEYYYRRCLPERSRVRLEKYMTRVYARTTEIPSKESKIMAVAHASSVIIPESNTPSLVFTKNNLDSLYDLSEENIFRHASELISAIPNLDPSMTADYIIALHKCSGLITEIVEACAGNHLLLVAVGVYYSRLTFDQDYDCSEEFEQLTTILDMTPATTADKIRRTLGWE